jgi:hypothetical protein
MNIGKTGYLMIDHRASPGLPEDLAISLRLDPTQCGEGKILEADTLTCSHCKTVVMKNPLRLREREVCAKCGFHYVCDICAAAMQHADYVHAPYEAIRWGDAPSPLGSPPKLILPDEPL